VDHEVEHDVDFCAAQLEPGEPLGFDEHRAVHAPAQGAKRLVVALDVAALQDELAARRRGDERVGLGERSGDRLLDEEVQAVLEALERHRMVPVGRHRDYRGIGLVQKVLIAGKSGAAHLLRQRRGARGVGIRHAGERDSRQAGKLLRVVATHVARPDHCRPQ
jgi:hypothetical protein